MTQDDEAKMKGWRPRTRMVRAGLARSSFGETSEALFLTSGYVYDSPEQAESRFLGEDDGFIYSRFGNPTVRMFEQRLALIEGADDCRATATGMAAVFAALMCFLKAGDHVVAGRALFGSCRYILQHQMPRYGIDCSFIDGRDLDAWRAAIRPNTRCLFIETPSNPRLDLIDIAAVAKMGREIGARIFVDNVFATPLLQRPLSLGADIVVYSTTKHIDGQGRCLGGAILGPQDYIEEDLTPFLRNTGPSLSPFNAWVMVKGLETLDLRVRASMDSAARLADRLADHPKIERVFYPYRSDFPQSDLARVQMLGGGTMLSFSLKGGKDAAFSLLRGLRLIDISNNLGDSKSLITHPATTTHSKLSPEERAELGIVPGLLRLSVGLEDAEDLWADLEASLDGNC